MGNFLGSDDDDGQTMLTEHWDGSTWSQVPTRGVQRFDEKLLAVSPATANDVWAVGSTNRTGFAHTDPLAAHWDSTSWSIVPTRATTGGAKSILSGVANLGSTNAWAVGRSHSNLALIEDWDGSAWTVVPSPDPAIGRTLNGARQVLNGVVEISPSNVWAVGNTIDTVNGSFTPDQPLALHWKGTAWTPETTPGDLGAVR